MMKNKKKNKEKNLPLKVSSLNLYILEELVKNPPNWGNIIIKTWN